MESAHPPSRSSSPESTLLSAPLAEEKIQLPESDDGTQTVHVALLISGAKDQDLEAIPGTRDPTLTKPDDVRNRSARKRLILGLLALFALSTILGVPLALVLHPHSGDYYYKLPDYDHRVRR